MKALLCKGRSGVGRMGMIGRDRWKGKGSSYLTAKII